MLATVLNSERAVQVNIAIIRAFVKLRELLATNRDLARRFDELEQKYDEQFPHRLRGHQAAHGSGAYSGEAPHRLCVTAAR